MSDSPLIWIIMGVSGSGKTAVGRLFAKQLECDFLEGDRRHPAANIHKMSAQTPLGDSDRAEWLRSIEDDIRRAVELGRETVIACSALKVSYRKQLVAPGSVQLVWLEVPRPELERRLEHRTDHFMSFKMLESQLRDFEPAAPDENIITIGATSKANEAVDKLMNRAIDLFPALKNPWWERLNQ